MTEDSPSQPAVSAEAERLYAELRVRIDAGEATGVEELVGAHPALADELRGLDREWCRVHDLLGARGSAAVSDAGSETAEEPSSSELIERLSSRSRPADRYRVRGEVARGGMGAILRVWDEDLRRTLAMKVVLGQDGKGTPTPMEDTDPKTVSRFLEEAQVTGQLDHPGIVPVHELGVDGRRSVYFTMRLVRGRDLRRVIGLVHSEQDGWTLPRALVVVQKVCEAMAYAHEKGVIHRDLKPANVMVGRFGEVYVMDWGLARVLGREESRDIRPRPAAAVETDRLDRTDDTPGSSLCTMEGDVIGTPAYMSPEQARGRIGELDARTDVYAVGAMLYHLLTGRAPYDSGDGEVTPHALLARVIDGPPLPVHDSRRDVSPELASICEKAMARDRVDRYPDMMSLAEDLRAYLEDRVVRAHQTGAVAEFKKWVRRNRRFAGALAALLVLALGGSIGFALYQRSVRDALEVQTTKAVASEGAAKRSAAQALAALRSAEGRRILTHAQDQLAADPELALLLAIEGAAYTPGPEANDLLLRSLRDAGLLRAFGGGGGVHALRFTGDGARLLTAAADFSIAVWDYASGERVATLEGARRAIVDVVCDEAGRYAAALTKGRFAHVWDLRTGEWLRELSLADWPFEVAFEPSGAVRLRNRRGFARAWMPETGLDVRPSPGAELDGGAPRVSPDGRFAVLTRTAEPARVFDAATNELLFELPAEAGDVRDVAFGPAGDLLVTAGGTSTLHIWNTATWESLRTLHAYDQPFLSVDIDSTGEWILTGVRRRFSLDTPESTSLPGGTLALWRAASGERWATIGPVDALGRFVAVAFDPAGEFVVAAERDADALCLPVDPLAYAETARPRGLLAGERARFGIDRARELLDRLEEGE